MDVQAALERATEAAFARGETDDDATRSTRLAIGGMRYRLRLSFLGRSGTGHLYELALHAQSENPPDDVAGETRSIEAWFDLWTAALVPLAPDPLDPPADATDAASVEERRAVVAAWRDAEAALRDPVRLQRTILAALRDEGRAFSTAHKEGGTILRFDGRHFVSVDYGESHAVRRFADDAAFLAHLRRFFDHETSRHAWPGRVSEADAWRLILRRLDPPPAAGRGRASVDARAGLPRWWRAFAFAAVCVIAAGLAIVKWPPRAAPTATGEPVRAVGPGRPAETDWERMRDDHRRAVEAARPRPER
jgi:hypothetical protein